MAQCCISCFKDHFIKDKIQNEGIRGDCEYCGTSDTICIDPSDLTEIFDPVIQLYDVTTYGQHYGYDDDPSDHGQLLDELIDEDWQVFSEDLIPLNRNDLLFDIINSGRSFEDRYDSLSLYSASSASFTHVSSEDVWEEFCNEIMYENRFFLRNSFNLELGDVLNRNSKILPINTELFRARVGGKRNSYGHIIGAFPIEEMKSPPRTKTKTGRANPVGISYLYTATNVETVIAEVRPWKSALISVAQFTLKQNMRFVDLTSVEYIQTPFGYEDLRDEIEKRLFLWALRDALSKPIDPASSELEYIPLQYLTEFIKHIGFDGVIFKSSLGSGDNVVIFNEENTDSISCEIYEINNIRYSYRLHRI